MELGKHLTKGMWGLADKALPVVYGIGYVWLVIRVLPETEFGNFVLVQEVFLVISGLSTAFALQPLLKFSSEQNADLRGVVSASMFLNAIFILLASLLVALCSVPAGQVFNSPTLAPLMLYVPAMLAASFFRNFTLTLLQSKFRVQEIFAMDAVHFVGAPVLIWGVSRLHLFNSAMDLVMINLVSLSLSSLAGIWFARGMMHLSLRLSREAVTRVWDYGKYSLGGIVSSLVSTRADSFILSAFGGPIQVAVYNSAKIFVRVYEMAAQVVQMFILPAASKLSSQGDHSSLKALTEKAILFLTFGLLPVTVLFLVLPDFLVAVLYGGRYTEAAPILRVFSLLTFVVPLAAVGSNVLMGLGEARLSFFLGLQILAISLVSFLLCIPPLGVLGAAIGYLGAALGTAALTVRLLSRHIPLSAGAVMRRTKDIHVFLRNRL